MSSNYDSGDFEGGGYLRRETIREHHDRDRRHDPRYDGHTADNRIYYDQEPRPQSPLRSSQHPVQNVLGRPSALSTNYFAPKMMDGMSLNNRLELESYHERESGRRSRSLTPPSRSDPRRSHERFGPAARTSDGYGHAVSVSTSQSPPPGSLRRRERSRSPPPQISQRPCCRDEYRDRYDNSRYHGHESVVDMRYDRSRAGDRGLRQYRGDNLYLGAERTHPWSDARREHRRVADRDPFEIDETRYIPRFQGDDKLELRRESVSDYNRPYHQPPRRGSFFRDEEHYNHHPHIRHEETRTHTMDGSREGHYRASDSGERFEHSSHGYARQHGWSDQGQQAEDDGWTTVPSSRRARRQTPSRQETSTTIAARQSSEPSPPEVHFIPPTNLNSNYRPFMLVLCGIPGSGKTTFARGLTVGKPWMYTRVNQDTLGNRRACEELCYDVLQQGKVPVVDRCNFNFQQRRHFLNIAKRCNVPVDCVVFEFDVELCISRAQARQEHETIAPHMAREVCERMLRDFFPPQAMRSAENFRTVKRVRSVEEAEDVMMEYLHMGF